MVFFSINTFARCCCCMCSRAGLVAQPMSFSRELLFLLPIVADITGSAFQDEVGEIPFDAFPHAWLYPACCAGYNQACSSNLRLC